MNHTHTHIHGVLALDLDHTLVEHTLAAYRPYPDTSHTVWDLSRFLRLHLVTACKNGTLDEIECQKQKIHDCGISACFDGRIHIVPNERAKFAVMKKIRKDSISEGFHISRIFAVGDRADVEICFANKLKMTSIQVLRGKYAGVPILEEDHRPKHTVQTFREVLPLLGGLCGLVPHGLVPALVSR